MESLWSKEYKSSKKAPTLRGHAETDTVIIGGGMAGILCAHMLAERGVDNIVVEADRIGAGVTMNTTAKITAQHGAVYSKIDKRYGPGAAADYLRANTQAIGMYRALAAGIPCDFEDKTAYIYSRGSLKALTAEADIYRRMGVDAVWQRRPNLPAAAVAALGMPGQAQFHPIKFIMAIAEGLKIYENTFVTAIQPGRVLTERGSISARRVILATHFPLASIGGFYFMKMYQHRSYVLALEGAPDPGGMYIDEQEGGLSLRTHGNYLLLGGGSHRTGQQGGGWGELRHVAATAYPGARECYSWATQDCMTLDAMPYIGRHSQNSRELYVATGFNKWGMTGSMVAARVLSDIITGGGSRYERLFNPSRTMLHPQLLANMGHAVAGLLTPGKRCPHMGCALKWNAQEHSWDCPCHGSRFDHCGKIINGPAKRGTSTE